MKDREERQFIPAEPGWRLVVICDGGFFIARVVAWDCIRVYRAREDEPYYVYAEPIVSNGTHEVDLEKGNYFVLAPDEPDPKPAEVQGHTTDILRYWVDFPE